MPLEPVIGLEIHVQLKTKSKMFCRCANVLSDTEPNSAICPVCLGYPGSLPVPNREAISMIQKAGAALNCQLALRSKFDRKSYFYPDLPKGYQISQFDEPFCGEGGLEIIVNGERRVIGVERIHLEEDAAKNTHSNDSTLVDYNRGGTPLMEIVTKPDIKTPEEAKIFLQELQKIMRTLNVSDADMEKGQMRCDANISLKEAAAADLNPKTEVKNINSFKFVKAALEHEIKRQQKMHDETGTLPENQSTRGFDSDKGITTEQRTKEEAADYRYFSEPDIPPFTFTQNDLDKVTAEVPELPLARVTRLMRQTGIAEDKARLLVDESRLGKFFEAVVSELEQLDRDEVSVNKSELPKLISLAANIILREVRSACPEEVPTKLAPQNFAELVLLIHISRISKESIKPVIDEMIKTGGDPDHIIDNLGLEQIGGGEELEQIVRDVIQANQDIIQKIKAGKDSAIQVLVGQVMARTQGKANPADAIRIIRKNL